MIKNSNEYTNRIIIAANSGIPEYFVQIKKNILFLKSWFTVREKNLMIGKKLHFDSLEQAKDYIKRQGS